MLGIALCIVAVLCAIVALFTMLVFWLVSLGDCPKIKFSSFKKFYEINPDRWHLSDDYVACRKDNSFGIISTNFGFVDFYRYKLWRMNSDRRDRQKSRTKNLADIIACVKKDIEHTEQVAAQKYKEAKDILTARN